MSRTNEIASKIKLKAHVDNEHAISMAIAVQKLSETGIPEDYLIEVIAHAATLENPEPYMDMAIMGAYYKTKVESV